MLVLFLFFLWFISFLIHAGFSFYTINVGIEGEELSILLENSTTQLYQFYPGENTISQTKEVPDTKFRTQKIYISLPKLCPKASNPLKSL